MQRFESIEKRSVWPPDTIRPRCGRSAFRRAREVGGRFGVQGKEGRPRVGAEVVHADQRAPALQGEGLGGGQAEGEAGARPGPG